jgi:hypothetical protein
MEEGDASKAAPQSKPIPSGKKMTYRWRLRGLERRFSQLCGAYEKIGKFLATKVQSTF